MVLSEHTSRWICGGLGKISARMPDCLGVDPRISQACTAESTMRPTVPGTVDRWALRALSLDSHGRRSGKIGQ